MPAALTQIVRDLARAVELLATRARVPSARDDARRVGERLEKLIARDA